MDRGKAIKESWIKRQIQLEASRPPLAPITYESIAKAPHCIMGEYMRVKLLQRSRHRYGWIDEHRAIAEVALGHPLPELAEVHHFNEIKTDNRHCNLVICQDFAYHLLLHLRRAVQLAGGNPNTDKLCIDCGVQPKSAFNLSNKVKGVLKPRCKKCAARRLQEWRYQQRSA